MKKESFKVVSNEIKLNSNPPVAKATMSLIAPDAVLTKTLPGKYYISKSTR